MEVQYTWRRVSSVLLLWYASGVSALPEDIIDRDSLVADVREFTRVIETSHPDPYTVGGGRVAYHRRLQELVRELPKEGLAKPNFAMRLQRFLACIGDGHTTMDLPKADEDRTNPGGVPLYLGVVEQQLYVEAVTDDALEGLIGSRLVSVEGVAVGRLVEREHHRRGHDNIHHALYALSRSGSLYYRASLADIVPEWGGGGTVKVTLRHPSGELRTYELAVSANVSNPLLKTPSRIELPRAPRWLGYDFLDTQQTTAYLWIHNMTTYREMYEYSRSVGSPGWQDWVRQLYTLIHGTPAPESDAEAIAGIPSAAETFAALFGEMKQAGAHTLVVDLRNNYGGNDLMVQLLLYYLVGIDEMVTASAQTSTVRKLSPLLAASTAAGIDPGTVAYADAVPLVEDDYDFSTDSRFMASAELRGAVAENYASMFRHLPAFRDEFESGRSGGLYKPERIYVLVSNATQSSGFDLMTQLQRVGAVTVGVTPSQAGNSFGNIQQFKLAHSGLTGWVSTKYFVNYPDQAATGYAATPRHSLSYAQLAAYDFDPNATLLLALEIDRNIGGHGQASKQYLGSE